MTGPMVGLFTIVVVYFSLLDKISNFMTVSTKEVT